MSGASPPVVAFVEASTTGAGELALLTCRNLGVQALLLCRERDQYSPDILRAADIVLEGDTRSSASVVALLREFEESNGTLRAVTTTADLFVPQAAEAARAIGLPGLRPESAWTARLKDRTRSCLARAAPELNPPFAIVDSVQAAIDGAKAIGFPLVVKATDLNDGEGVRRIDDMEELADHLSDCLAPNGMPVGRHVLLEGFCDGPEFSAEVIASQGAAPVLMGVTEKYLAGAEKGCFVEVGHAFPAAGDAAGTVAEAALKALSAIGFDCGAAHVECRLTKAGPKIMEINPRLAGGKIGSHLIELAIGVSAPELVVRVAMGETVAWQQKRSGAAALRNVYSDIEGHFYGLRNRSLLEGMPGVVAIINLVAEGTPVQAPKTNRDMLVAVIARGRDCREAYCRAEAAADRAELRLAPSPAGSD